jgi:hypothetical protein
MDSLDALINPRVASEHDEAVFDELHELDLASQLLEVTDPNELDRFLRTLILRAARAPGGRPAADTLRALHALLRKASRKTVPSAARALGVRSAPSRLAGKLFGLELEGLSSEDQDFEVARRFVRFGANAARNAARLRRRAPPRVAARSAVIRAARRLAPGLLRTRRGFPAPQAAAPGSLSQAGGSGFAGAAGSSASTQNGDWVRQGRNIIIVNCPGATVSTPSDAPEPGAAEPAAAEPSDATAPPPGGDEPPV